MSQNMRWCQIRHRDCGGEMVVVVKENRSGMGMCCKKCLQIWTKVDSFPEDWEMVLVTVPNDGRIVIPGRENGGR